MKTILICGFGYVGQAMTDFFKNHYQIEVYDPLLFGEQNAVKVRQFKNRYRGLQVTRCENFSEKKYDLAVVCVPTPMKESKRPFKQCDTSIVEEMVDKINAVVILIKSTVEPGFCDELKEKTHKQIVFSPEYIGENKYWSPYKFHADMKETPFYIFGGHKEDCEYVFNMFVPVAGPKKEYFITSALNAEIIKYMENTYFAVKVTFAQEMYEVTKALGGYWPDVWRGWALDPRVDIMHTAVFPESRGFGGKCLPKDTNALVYSSMQAGYRPNFLIEMIKSNDKFKNKD